MLRFGRIYRLICASSHLTAASIRIFQSRLCPQPSTRRDATAGLCTRTNSRMRASVKVDQQWSLRDSMAMSESDKVSKFWGNVMKKVVSTTLLAGLVLAMAAAYGQDVGAD